MKAAVTAAEERVAAAEAASAASADGGGASSEVIAAAKEEGYSTAMAEMTAKMEEVRSYLHKAHYQNAVLALMYSSSSGIPLLLLWT